MSRSPDPSLPAGVTVRTLAPCSDRRGSLTECFRQEWDLQEVAQLNLLRSVPGTLRGVHVHAHRADLILPIDGELLVGLRDARVPAEPGVLLPLATGQLLTIPSGVAHGFLSVAPSVVLYGLSRHWDGTDELACRWDDPALGLPWPCGDPTVSERDHAGGTWSEVVAAWAAATAVTAVAR